MSRRPSTPLRLAPALVACALLAACNDTQAPAPATPVAAPAAPTPPPPPPLVDVLEQTPRAIVGISYPPELNAYPGLVAEARHYSDGMRRNLDDALAKLTADPASPYELTLAYTVQLKTPTLVSVAADGSLFLGGDYSQPLTRRFVWWVPQQRVLRSHELMADPAGWRTVSDYVREQMYTAMSARADADELPPAERAPMMRRAGSGIEQATTPAPEYFMVFEPVLDPATDTLTGLRFLFPTLVGDAYAPGMDRVEVPAEVLRPLLKPEFAALFAPPAPAAPAAPAAPKAPPAPAPGG